MKKIYLREIRHIVANHSLRNQATAYCRNSKSVAVRSVNNLIKHSWLICDDSDGPFLFVSPSKKLVKAYGFEGTNNKKSAIPVLQGNLMMNEPAKDFSVKYAGFVAA